MSHLALSEFTKQEHSEDCKAKDDSQLFDHFGLAGGGYGHYRACELCFAVREKECLADDED